MVPLDHLYIGSSKKFDLSYGNIPILLWKISKIKKKPTSAPRMAKLLHCPNENNVSNKIRSNIPKFLLLTSWEYFIILTCIIIGILACLFKRKVHFPSQTFFPVPIKKNIFMDLTNLISIPFIFQFNFLELTQVFIITAGLKQNISMTNHLDKSMWNVEKFPIKISWSKLLRGKRAIHPCSLHQNSIIYTLDYSIRTGKFRLS